MAKQMFDVEIKYTVGKKDADKIMALMTGIKGTGTFKATRQDSKKSTTNPNERK